MVPWPLLLLALLILASVRACWIVFHRPRPAERAPDDPCSLALFLGSGGHTHEILSVLKLLDRKRYAKRVYVYGAGDGMSVRKAAALELEFARTGEADAGQDKTDSVDFIELPRARAVGQSLVSAVWTTARTLIVAFCKVTLRPQAPLADLLLLNGPGTCIPLVLSIWAARFVGRSTPRIIYLESFARTSSLSLTGKILVKLALAERVAVQWEGVKEGELVRVVV